MSGKDCECENCRDECSGTDCTPENCDCRNADRQRQQQLQAAIPVAGSGGPEAATIRLCQDTEPDDEGGWEYTVTRAYPRAFDVRNKGFFKASMFTGDAVRWAIKAKLKEADLA